MWTLPGTGGVGGDEELRRADLYVALDAEPEQDLHSGLDRAPADLSVALRGVPVARGEQRAVDADGQEKCRSRCEVPYVDVAAESWR